MKKRKAGASPRLNIRLSADLIEWVKDYAARRNTTVTSIIEAHLHGLRILDTDVPQV